MENDYILKTAVIMVFNNEEELLFKTTKSILFSLDSVEQERTNPGFIAFGKHNSYPSMKGVIYEARFSINSWQTDSLPNYLKTAED